MSSDEHTVSRRGFLRTAAGSAAATGAVGTATAQEDGESSGDYPGSGQTEEVVVGPGGSLVFEPAELQILQGTTVNFVWESDGHNIVVESQPDGANWEGTKGGSSALYDTGHKYSHTFTTLGTYEYVCAPHASAGMVGTIEVVEEISTPAPASGPPEIPDSAKTLGIAGIIGMGSTLGLAYFLLRFGGDYEQG
ncbi:plastocyanin/azurin family copper-binding protein [Halosegnis sp.]|uniref:plastocyanin/azurin family copper-binding protein n=1 Tax=Halosegnis sp. TaxID=2864959 RepID=UPI0035D43446